MRNEQQIINFRLPHLPQCNVRRRAGKNKNMSEMKKAWIAAGLNPDTYSAACADAMKIYNKPFYDLLVGYMEWEAMLIEDNAMWWPSVSKDRISGKSYDKMMELQSKRNELLSR